MDLLSRSLLTLVLVPLTLFLMAAMPSRVAAQSQDKALERARKLLRSTPLIDGHNDLPWEIRQRKDAPRDVSHYDLRKTTEGHTDLARLTQAVNEFAKPGDARHLGAQDLTWALINNPAFLFNH